MPLCMKDGFDTKNYKHETFHDDEEVFFCETTMQIFRNYEDYFRHVMVINSTVWQCEITGRENLTFSEALRSEKRARKKMDMFKNSLRPVVMLLIEQAKQSSYKQLNAIIWKFLRKRYFFNEEITATRNKSSTYNAYKVIAILPSDGAKISPTTAYEDTENFQYKLLRIENPQKNGSNNNSETNPREIIVPFESIRRQRFELTTENLQMFIKHNVIRVDGILHPKPESYKKYITDSKITFASLFIGKMPHFTPAKIKTNKQSSINDFLLKTEGGVNSKEKIIKQSAEEIKKKMQQERAEKAEAKKASLKEEMERLRREKQEKLAEAERQRVEKRAKLLEKIELECTELLIKSDDLERKDQRLLPKYTPIKTFIPTKLLGDAFMLREFMHSFVNILSGLEVFRGNLSFIEMSRAFTVREVAGPLSDILIVLLGTIFDLQKEEEDECSVEYIKSKNYFKKNELYDMMTLAGSTFYYTKRHYSSKVNELPIDALTLSEVLRLHLLLSGAKVKDRAEKWRIMYRNGYFSSEDPGLRLRQQYPHILKALRQYTVYHLPFLDIMRIVRCLMDQILTYSNTISIMEERMEQMAQARNELRTLSTIENRRLAAVQVQKRTMMNEYNQQCMDDNIKNDAEKKRQLEEKLNKRIVESNVQSDRERRKHEQQVEKHHSAIFNFLVYLGMDRAYRKYYVLESMPGIFIEHADECYDRCLDNPPENKIPTGALLNVANLPRNRKDLRTYLLRMYTEEERKAAAEAAAALSPTTVIATQQTKDAKIKEENITSQENKENTEIKENQEVRSLRSVMNGKVEKFDGVNKNSNTTEENKIPLKPPTNTELYMCSGNKHDCIVHYDRHSGRHHWSFLYEKEDVEALIESLNPLGERESHLRDQLTVLRTLILNHVRKCPYDMLTIETNQMNKYKNIMLADTHRKYGKSNFGFSEGTNINNIMEGALIERILQFEHEIYTGDLGCLKVKDLAKWRNNVNNNVYDAQVKLQWGPGAVNVNGEDNINDEDMDSDDDEGVGTFNAHKPYRDPGEQLGETRDIDSEDSADDEISLHDSKSVQDSVRSLASALLQVEQGIQRRFIKEPFGAPVKELKDKDLYDRKTKAGAERLKQWEVSLMECASYSQVFLHLNVLHDSILWARSTTKSFCQVCRRGSDPEKMLLCDECNGGTHMFCMKPKMKIIPAGNWYCKKCVARLGLRNSSDDSKNKITSTRKRTFVMDEEDNGSEISSTSSSGKVNGRIRTSDRRNKKHMNNSEIEEMLDEDNDGEDDDQENGVDEENDDEEIEEDEGEHENEQEDEENDLDDDNDGNDIDDDDYEVKNKKRKTIDSGEADNNSEDEDENVCVVCSYEGGDVLCISCKDYFHLECINLKRTPRSYTCSKCKAYEDRKRKSKPNGRHQIDDSNDDDEDGLSAQDNFSKRPRRSRNSFVNGNEPTQRLSNQRRSHRRTGDQLPLDSSTLYELLDDVMKHEQAWPFLRPVSQSEVPDYYKIIKDPMDLAKVKSKLNMGKYQLNEEVLNDIQLIFSNCDQYNVKGNEIYQAGCALEKFVIKRCKTLNLPFKPSDMND